MKQLNLKAYDIIPFTAICAICAIAVSLAVTLSAGAQGEESADDLTSVKKDILYIKLFLNESLPEALGTLIGRQESKIKDLESRIEELEYQQTKPKKKFKADRFPLKDGPIG